MWYTTKEVIEALNKCHTDILDLRRLISDAREAGNKPSEFALRTLEKDKAAKQEQIVEDLLRYPTYHVGHWDNVRKFQAQYTFDKAVFIMTRFPDQDPAKQDRQLAGVIAVVKAAVVSRGYTAHLASDRDLDPMLWSNVVTYLLACGKGIAIVEDKGPRELNPNVMMEWGWMRAMQRDVLYLREKTFSKDRADLAGLITNEFDWEKPEPGIERAVKGFLPSDVRALPAHRLVLSRAGARSRKTKP